MGWTTCNASHYTSKGNVDRKAECDSLYTWENEYRKITVEKSRMIGSVYYGAIRIHCKDGEEPDQIVGVVVLTNAGERGSDYFNFGYKSIEETMGPCESKCPKSILDLLTPTDNEFANEWRKRCRDNLNKKKLVIPRNATAIVGICKVATTANNVGDKVTFIKRNGFWFFTNCNGVRYRTTLPMIRSTMEIKCVVKE